MKRITILAITILAMAFNATAQEVQEKKNNIYDNLSLGMDAGFSFNMHDADDPCGYLWGIQVAKGFNPILGLEFSAQAGFNNNANWNVAHSGNAIDNLTAMISGKLNITNWIYGYENGPHFFEIQARGGVGYMHSFWTHSEGSSNGHRSGNGVAKVGLDFNFNLGESKEWTLSLRPAAMLKMNGDDAMCDKGICDNYLHNVQAQITFGVAYNFNRKKKHICAPAPAPAPAQEFLSEQPAKKDTIEIEKIFRDTIYEPKTIVEEYSTLVIEFELNKATLTYKERAKLDKVPEGASVVINAYASPEGTKQYNKELSQRRADVVKRYLENSGVKVLSAVGHGAESITSQRIVYVTLK